MGAAVRAPKYLRETGYRSPTDPSDGFMQYAFQTKLSSFELFHSIPWVMEDFNKFMGNSMGARQIWTDWYPMQEQLIDGLNPDTPLLIDIGGGWGHDILAFHSKYPNKGKLILQDLPEVVKNKVSTLESVIPPFSYYYARRLLTLDSYLKREFPPGVEAMGYDFFTEQPVKGKHILYYQPRA